MEILYLNPVSYTHLDVYKRQVLKVLDRTGNGRKEDVLQAFRWILENKRYYGIRVDVYKRQILSGISVGDSGRSI